MGSVPVKLNLVNYLILWMLTLYVFRKPKSQVSSDLLTYCSGTPELNLPPNQGGNQKILT